MAVTRVTEAELQAVGWIRRLLEIDLNGVGVRPGPDGPVYGISGVVKKADHMNTYLLGTRTVPCTGFGCPICAWMGRERHECKSGFDKSNAGNGHVEGATTPRLEPGGVD